MSERPAEETTEEKILKDAEEIKADAEEIKEDLNEIKEELEEVKNSEESEDYKSKFFYLAAEMDNMKKRFERDKSNLVKFGNEKVLSELLEVVDNLDRTIDAIANDEDEKVKNIYQGIEMVRNQFLNTLKNNGLEKVNALGEIFDPNFHEAMAQQPAEGKKDQEIIQVFQHGYSLNGRLLRAAKVVIAKND
ncbi:MAG: nucleotide exchange factor GrpE [Halobacteriovoraceae bacterium]|nr:nucleotide exchange factor GrpE [Halobacteriovoraceae bacterium]MBC98466.1 nucleotide exchange factor GrpE [Halobacteriovoraceae bacterium]|tara:strand:- start:804 stop:1376 length:573 start_codon:yes stop_codon:yes gene_type:complete